jgi:hypothetical protein
MVMGLRSLHAFNHEYASAFALLKAVFAHRRPRPGMPKVPGYVAHFACREGSWLAAAKALGVARVMGIDTIAMRETPLCIEPGEFHDMDLAQIKVLLPQKADLIICVEYAHQLNPERGAGLVADLCESADLVLFGAGIPRQDNHPDHNYQWQSYWAKQFAEHGFLPEWRFRERCWSDKTVAPAYRQNCVLYVRAARMPKKLPDFERLDVVHPAAWEALQERQRALALQLTRSTIRQLSKWKS